MLAARRLRDIGSLLALVVLSSWAPRAGLAAGLPAQEFVPLSTEGTAGVFGPPQLADNGKAVYWANGEIVVSDGGPVTRITTAGQDPIPSARSPGISNDGSVVAFVAIEPKESISDPDVTSVFVARESSVPGTFTYTKIADESDGFDNYENLQGVSVNNSGMATFAATEIGTLRKNLLTGDGGPLSVVTPIQLRSNPAINNSGAVAYLRANTVGYDLNVLPAGIHIAGTTPYENIGEFAISDSGFVSFAAALDGTNIRGIYSGDGNVYSTIVDSTGPYDAFDVVSVNNFSQYAFLAELDAGNVKGLYRGPDPVSDKVIAPGDVLFGKVVTGVFITRRSINNKGDIAASVSFAGDDIADRARVFRIHKLSKFDNLPPDALDPHAQLSTAGGTGVDLFTPVFASDDQIVGGGNLELSFDLDFLLAPGALNVKFGVAELGTFDSDADGHVVISNIDPGSLYPAGSPPAALPLSFSLLSEVGQPTTVQLDNILLTNAAGMEFFRDNFSVGENGYLAANWQIDGKRGGVVSLDALVQGYRGDFDNDGDVDRDDLAAWQKSYAATALADADEDGDTDGKDFLIWQQQFHRGSYVRIAARAVPESRLGSLLLVLGGISTLIRQPISNSTAMSTASIS